MVQNIFQKFYIQELKSIYAKFSGNPKNKNLVIVGDIVGDTQDLQKYFEALHKSKPQNSRILVTYYNHLWEPILWIASKFGLRKNVGIQNWLNEQDISGILNLAGFEIVSLQRRVLLPVEVPLISAIFNKYLANLPFLSNLCLLTIVIARQKPLGVNKYSVSIIIPARNEEANIRKIIPSIPVVGKSVEYIFVEGHSTDGTWEEIVKTAKKYSNVKYYKQKKNGKADAVRMGFAKASGDILVVYDADRTVEGSDLSKFYNALATGVGEFANGSRLIYPMKGQAMQTLNKIGNKLFSLVFSWILGQRFKDTLCGTKAFFRKDYLNFKQTKSDPFGDFDLIFGAVRNNLKVVEIPVRYKEREYGSTNIKRFRHGLMLAQNAASAFLEFKSW